MKKQIFLIFFASFFTCFAFFAFAKNDIIPAAPRGFDACAGETIYEFNLSWINPIDADLDHVNIFLSQDKAYAGSLAKTVSAQPNTKGTATIKQVGSGTTYYLYLIAFDASGNQSAPTTELKRTTASTADKTSPAAIAYFVIQAGAQDGSAILSWTNSADDDFFQTRLYRSKQSEFSPSQENEIAAVFGLPGGTSEYTDTGLENGETYYYKIRTEDNRENLQTGLFYPMVSIKIAFAEAEEEPGSSTPEIIPPDSQPEEPKQASPLPAIPVLPYSGAKTLDEISANLNVLIAWINELIAWFAENKELL